MEYIIKIQVQKSIAISKFVKNSKNKNQEQKSSFMISYLIVFVVLQKINLHDNHPLIHDEQ